MIGEVISIGDELTSGQRLDTNSQWLSEQLGELGVAVRFHTTVADDLDANVEVLRVAVGRADVVVATGGLGPTADDLTRDALARLVGRPLLLDEAALAHIQGLFARHRREMPERNRVQALFPQGSRPIPNPQGTAPGIELEIPRPRGACHIFALPGVPAEMRQMFAASVGPAIARLMGGTQVICHRRIKCFGVGESHLEQMLPDLIRRGRQPSVGITVHAATITLRVTTTGATRAACLTAMEPTLATIRQCLGTLVFGEEDDELEDVVARQLVERGQRLASIECGSGGLLAEWLTRAAGGGDVFAGGLVVPAAAAIARWNDARPAAPSPTSQADLSSAEGVAAAAEWCRRRTGADFALAIGAFPILDSQAAEAPQYHYALATGSRALVRHGTLASHGAIWQPRAAKAALNLLRLWLLGHEA